MPTRHPGLTHTFSLVALDAVTGYLGAAVASRYFAVGSVVPHLRQGVGAFNSQHMHSHRLALYGLNLLQQGGEPQSTIETVLVGDKQPNLRQLLTIDAQGRKAAYTGQGCAMHCGHVIADTCAAAGNTLAGQGVLDAMVRIMDSYRDTPFVLRMIRALQAAEDAGGDCRGKQSAAIVTCPASLHVWDSDYPDLRVDDSEEPLAELMRLYRRRWEGKGW